MINFRYFLWIEALLVLISSVCFAQNPLIRDQFTADPSVRVFDDRVYVFPSHDILATEDKGRKDWFCMEDYHVFSSATSLKAFSEKGGVLQIASKAKKQTVITEVIIPEGSNWTETKLPLLKFESGIQDLSVTSKSNNQVKVDWIRFE